MTIHELCEISEKIIDELKSKDVIMVSRGHILHSIYPKFSEDYKGSQCWHGCDKVSIINGSGGGGS